MGYQGYPEARSIRLRRFMRLSEHRLLCCLGLRFRPFPPREPPSTASRSRKSLQAVNKLPRSSQLRPEKLVLPFERFSPLPEDGGLQVDLLDISLIRLDLAFWFDLLGYFFRCLSQAEPMIDSKLIKLLEHPERLWSVFQPTFRTLLHLSIKQASSCIKRIKPLSNLDVGEA